MQQQQETKQKHQKSLQEPGTEHGTSDVAVQRVTTKPTKCNCL